MSKWDHKTPAAIYGPQNAQKMLLSGGLLFSTFGFFNLYYAHGAIS